MLQVTAPSHPHNGPMAPRPLLAAGWMAQRGWAPFDFQREVWAAMQAGQGGLLHASTGTGKTYAVALGALPPAQALGLPLQGRAAPPLGVLRVTPMRALAADTTRAWAAPLADLAPAWTLGQRSGDTASAERAHQDKRLPTVLVSTPESLTLLLTRDAAARRPGQPAGRAGACRSSGPTPSASALTTMASNCWPPNWWTWPACSTRAS